jgi:hypothetical protein
MKWLGSGAYHKMASRQGEENMRMIAFRNQLSAISSEPNANIR